MVRAESRSGRSVSGRRWVFREVHVEEDFDPDEVQEFHQPRQIPRARLFQRIIQPPERFLLGVPRYTVFQDPSSRAAGIT
jgi:hypothetical protein